MCLEEMGNKRPPLPFNWDSEEKKENGTQHVSDDSSICVCVCVQEADIYLCTVMD